MSGSVPIPTRGRLVIVSGAGLSADSGVATFRGRDGLWEGHRLDVVCSWETWRENHAAVHAFYNARRTQLAGVAPNAMHAAMARWADAYRAVHLTQNVDDLLERAGCTGVVHLHGHLTGMRCHACGGGWEVGYRAWDPAADACPGCGSMADVKPDVVFFGEAAPRYADLEAAFDSSGVDDVLLVVGTSGAVLPVNRMAQVFRGRTVLNNLEPGDAIDHGLFDHVLFGRAAEVAPKVDELLRRLFAPWGLPPEGITKPRR